MCVEIVAPPTAQCLAGMVLAWRNSPGLVIPARAGIQLLLAQVLLLASVCAQPPGEGDAPTLGAHTLLWQAQDHGVDPARSAPITTQARGSSFLVLNAGYRSNETLPSDSYSNTWRQVGEPAVFDGYRGQFDVKAYVVEGGVGGVGHTVSVVKPGRAAGEITLPFIEIRHAGVLQDMAQTYPAAAPSLACSLLGAFGWSGCPPPTPGRTRGTRYLSAPFKVVLDGPSVTTTGPATLIAVWLGDAYAFDMTAVPDNGFTVIEQLLQLPPASAVQCAVAYRDVDAAGTYAVRWTESPNQGAILWLFAFQAGEDVGGR